MIKELAILQEKIKNVDRLSNCISKAHSLSYKNEIAYTIHKICESEGYLSSELAREIQAHQIQTSGDIFMNVK